MARRMEIRPVEGLREVLTGTLLMTPASRMFMPSPEQQEQILLMGNAFIGRAALDPENDGTTVYAAYQWPETGPATLAFVWAVNTRRPDDTPAGNPFFFRAFTETQEPHEHLLSREDMEQQLAAYSVAQFGKPTQV